MRNFECNEEGYITLNTPWDMFDVLVIPRLAVEQVFGDLPDYQNSGTHAVAHCLFCNHPDTSFHIDCESLHWHCYECGELGHVIGYLMLRDDLEWEDAAHYLAELVGVDPKKLEGTWHFSPDELPRIMRPTKRLRERKSKP